MATQPNESQNVPAAAPCAATGKLKLFVTYTLALLAAIVGVLFVVIAMQPDDFNVARAATFKATPAAVFEQVNDFHKWDAWSPWAKRDPNAKGTYDGPTSGKDAKFAWEGNSDVGKGNMTIVESIPNELVRIRLEFIEPFAGTNDVEMKVEPQGDETKLTWSMEGKNNFMAKAIGLVMDCEKMCGDDFEKGLANMKTIVENPPVRTGEADAAKPADAEPAQPSES
jgi:hypothetical protein